MGEIFVANLTEAVIPVSCIEIDDNAFEKCRKLEKVIIKTINAIAKRVVTSLFFIKRV